MLYLASKSPRRRQLLEQIGIRFDVLDVDVPEIRRIDEPAEDYVSRVAREKAGAGLLQVAAAAGACVLGADTEVILDGEVFGKPADAGDAVAMLARLSGRTHQVVSVVWCVDASRASGEPFGRAGAYAIQGRAAAFIEHLSGSYSGVMGLPLHETAMLLREFGVMT
jgi:septum formation protein